MPLSTLFRRSRPQPAHWMDEPDPSADALLEMSSALVFGLQRLDAEKDLSGHAARVAEVADALAAIHQVSDELRAVLRSAALLHEVGMIGVPRELLDRTEPLTPDEAARLRAHAEVGASIARATCGDLAATLIRHQFDDEATLRSRLGEGSDAYLLAGFLRAAKLGDVMSRERPGAAGQVGMRIPGLDGLPFVGAPEPAAA